MNKIEHNEEILKEIQNRIMIEIWSIIPISLFCTFYWHLYVFYQVMMVAS